MTNTYDICDVRIMSNYMSAIIFAAPYFGVLSFGPNTISPQQRIPSLTIRKLHLSLCASLFHCTNEVLQTSAMLVHVLDSIESLLDTALKSQLANRSHHLLWLKSGSNTSCWHANVPSVGPMKNRPLSKILFLMDN